MAEIDDIINTLIAEANAEGPEGMRRVAETMINRSAIRGLSLGDVVRQPHQYTGLANPGPSAVQAQQDPRVRQTALEALQLALQPGDPTGGADYYLNPSAANPDWASQLPTTGDYGDHRFFKSRPVPQAALANVLSSASGLFGAPAAPPQAAPAPASPQQQLSARGGGVLSGTFGANGALRPSTQKSIADMFGPVANGNTPRLTQAGTVASPLASGSDWASNIFPNTTQRTPARAPITANDLIASSGIADTVRNSQAQQDTALAAALERSIRPSAAPTDLISRSMTAAQNSISPSTQAAVEALVKPKPQMTVAQQRADNGQPAARSAQVRLPDIQPSTIGGPPTTRTVQSVPMSTRDPIGTTPSFADLISTFGAVKSDSPGVSRTANPTAGQAALPAGVRPNVPSTQAAPRMDGVGNGPQFSDMALMFGPHIPGPSGQFIPNKPQDRLAQTPGGLSLNLASAPAPRPAEDAAKARAPKPATTRTETVANPNWTENLYNYVPPSTKQLMNFTPAEMTAHKAKLAAQQAPQPPKYITVKSTVPARAPVRVAPVPASRPAASKPLQITVQGATTASGGTAVDQLRAQGYSPQQAYDMANALAAQRAIANSSDPAGNARRASADRYTGDAASRPGGT